MRFGICVMANVDEIGLFSHAETLGYDSVWVTDSQMLFSDCYAVLALAARQTTRLRLGPGTAICGTRIPPVQVAAVATLNRLAPGRVHLAVGTGNTAMRTMGQRPLRIAEYDDYLRVLSALLRGEVVDYTFNGVTRPITMLMHEREYMNLEPPIPLYVSGFGGAAPWSWPASTATASSSPSRRAGCRWPRPWPTRVAARRRPAARSPTSTPARSRTSPSSSPASESTPSASCAP